MGAARALACCARRRHFACAGAPRLRCSRSTLICMNQAGRPVDWRARRPLQPASGSEALWHSKDRERRSRLSGIALGSTPDSGGKMKTPMTLPASLLLAALGLSSCTSNEPPSLTADDVAALRAIADADAAVVLARDWDALAARFTSDAVRMPPGAPAIEGREAIRASLAATPPMQDFTFRMVSVEGDGHMAYMRAAWTVAVALPGAPALRDSGKILIVFEKQPDGSWLTVADAWNSDIPRQS